MPSAPNSKYRDGDAASFARFFDRLEQQLTEVPNLSFAPSTFMPFWEPPKQQLEMEHLENSELRASVTAAGPDYFHTLGILARRARVYAG